MLDRDGGKGLTGGYDGARTGSKLELRSGLGRFLADVSEDRGLAGGESGRARHRANLDAVLLD